MRSSPANSVPPNHDVDIEEYRGHRKPPWSTVVVSATSGRASGGESSHRHLPAQSGGSTCRCFFVAGRTAIARSCWLEPRKTRSSSSIRWGTPEDCPITQVRTFQLQFALTDRGELALERFGEGTKEEVVSFAYPLLENALDEAYREEGYEDTRACHRTGVRRSHARSSKNGTDSTLKRRRRPSHGPSSAVMSRVEPTCRQSSSTGWFVNARRKS